MEENTTVQTETTTNTQETEQVNVESTKQETSENNVYKVVEFKTEEEFLNYEKSLLSKGKGEILNRLGISKVDEGLEKLSKYDDVLKGYDELKASKDSLEQNNTELKNELEKVKEDFTVNKMGIKEEYKEDFLTLVKAKITNEKNFEKASEEVLGKHTYFRESSNNIGNFKIGSEKNKIDLNESKKKFTEKW